MPRKHYRNSLMGKLLKFFADNPDEELTYDDIAAKFGVPKRRAHSRISEAIKEGDAIQSVHVIRAVRKRADQ